MATSPSNGGFYSDPEAMLRAMGAGTAGGPAMPVMISAFMVVAWPSSTGSESLTTGPHYGTSSRDTRSLSRSAGPRRPSSNA